MSVQPTLLAEFTDKKYAKCLSDSEFFYPKRCNIGTVNGDVNKTTKTKTKSHKTMTKSVSMH